ncbi:MAG TPA: prolyl oligopeptidase family serine peptidase [Vicinamibacterales bacterium]|nr:prolyl oligopeptidase family serine peptidase [Vicinamibacterales bacterium]
MTPRTNAMVWRLVVPVALAVLPLSLAAQSGAQRTPDDILKAQGYQTPPGELADAVTAKRYLNVSLTSPSPDKKWFVDEIGDGPVLMKTFAKPFHELGGLFVDHKANRSRTLTIRNNVGIQLISAADGTRKPIQVPAGARVSNATWSPDSKSVAFFVHGEDATHIWVADAATGAARQATKTPVLATLVTTFEFTQDGRQIGTVLVPDARAAMPQMPAAPPGPTVKLAMESDKNRLRTFPSLMSTPYEEQLLEWHATGQLALVDVAKGSVRKIGAPAMIRAIDLAPDGRYARVTRMLRPFSYDVPVANFGQIEEIWDDSGKVLAKVSDRPINLGVQDDAPNPDPQAPPQGGGGGRGGQQTGKREVAWRTDGQGLTFVEQEPAAARSPAGQANRGGAPAPADDQPPAGGRRGAGGGDQAPPRKDRVYQWLPPFDAASQKVVYENPTRISGHRYSPDMQILFFSERAGQNALESAVYLNDTTKKYTLARYRADDVYANPGTLVSTRGTGGGGGRAGGAGGRGGGGGTGPVQLSADGTSVFFMGTAYDRNPNEVAPKAFVDRISIRTGEKERIFEGENNGIAERVAVVIDPDARKFVLSRESPKEVPQNHLLDGGRRVQLTKNVDPHEDLTMAKVEKFVAERADGFRFRVKVTLPPDYRAGTRLPALFWFYPREYSSQEEYDRPDRTSNKNDFTAFNQRSMEYFVRLGYAVVSNDAPIIGPQGQMNNNYINDLRNNLAATIDELDRRQIIDRQRLAIGGHSYGAFSTVNAMVHTPFFKAGIAGDGAYNRTLTPIGFQTERRDLWEAPNVYLGMSPFLYANNLTGALLMYHGLADQNVGTDPTNSIRLYHALNGLGKPTALYLYPLEDHGPATRETLLDLWARWGAWLDKYVKNPQKADPRKTTTNEQPSVVR